MSNISSHSTLRRIEYRHLTITLIKFRKIFFTNQKTTFIIINSVHQKFPKFRESRIDTGGNETINSFWLFDFLLQRFTRLLQFYRGSCSRKTEIRGAGTTGGERGRVVMKRETRSSRRYDANDDFAACDKKPTFNSSTPRWTEVDEGGKGKGTGERSRKNRR